MSTSVVNTTTGHTKPDTAQSCNTSADSQGPIPGDAETPADYIPGLYTLGSTYNVLNGKYADSKSALQQVIDWDKTESRSQQYAGKVYSIPKIVNYVSDTTSDYLSYYGKTMTEYTESLSAHAGFDTSFPGFSASASADYTDSERENLSNAFTRIMYVVTEYDLSLPPNSQLLALLKPWFVDDLENLDPVRLYKLYGTHMLRSLTVGGRASILTTTDTRSYSSDTSIEAAAHISANYWVVSGNVELSASQKEALQSFEESSSRKVETRGGDPRYGNEQFLPSASEWAASVVDYPEFIDFGAMPCFIGLWEFASTESRKDELQKAYTKYVDEYKADLELPGPYIRVRSTNDFVDAEAGVHCRREPDIEDQIMLRFPRNRSGDWYFTSPGSVRTIIHAGDTQTAYTDATMVAELVPGALAAVKWEKAWDDPKTHTRFWRAVPPHSDYVALGAVGVSGQLALSQDEPPAELVARFRAVHKAALTASMVGVMAVWTSEYNEECKIFVVDRIFWYADTVPLSESDCKNFDEKNAIWESSKRLESVF